MTARIVVVAAALLAIGGPSRSSLWAQAAPTRDLVHEASIAELQDGLRAGRWTSVQLVDGYLARIAAYDQRGPALNSMIRLNPRARREAAALDAERRRGTVRGALHGIPVVLKDNFDTADLPTSASLLALATLQPPDDGFVVRRLRAAGAVIIGKTNMHELAAGITSVSSLGGQTRNPYDPMRCPGGSSGGTGAAVAASFAAVGWGSDTCGSIRIPSAFNNLVGLRPTQGLASRDGIIPLSHTHDIPGPLARSARDLAIALDATVGYDPADSITHVARTWSPTAFSDSLTAFPVRGTRLAVLTNYMTGDIDADIRDTIRAVTRAMERAGATVVEARIADFDSLLANTGVIGFETNPDLEDYLRTVPGARRWTAREILREGLFHDAMTGRIISMDTSGVRESAAYRRALSRQGTLRSRLIALMDSLGVDALVYPTSRRRPVPVGEAQPGGTCGLSAFSGLPALSAPAGFTDAGLPVGIEFLGRPFSDVRLVGLAHALEQLLPRRAAPSTTPPLRAGRAPVPVSVTAVVQDAGARAELRLTVDVTANVVRYAAAVSGVRAADFHALVLRRAGSARSYDVRRRGNEEGTGTASADSVQRATIGAPVIHRLAGPGMLAASGSFPLSGVDRKAMAEGALRLTLVTSRGISEQPVRAVTLAGGVGMKGGEEGGTRTAPPAREGTLAAPHGARLFYRIIGQGSDTVVAIHGGPGVDLESIAGDLAPLGERHVVIFYDQRGAGRSTLPADTTTLNAAQQVADLEAVRQHFRLERMTLVAHSYGPLLAASYAIAHPTRVKRMVFFGPVPPRRGDFWQRFARNSAARMDSTLQAQLGDANRRLQRATTGDEIRAACRDYWRAAMVPRLAEPARTLPLIRSDLCGSDPNGIRFGLSTTNRLVMASYGDWDLRDALRALDVPVLIVHGEEEAIPMDLVQEWATALPRGQLVRVPRAAHFAYAERPELVWPTVEEFLRR